MAYTATVVYLVNQIKLGQLSYMEVIKARPDQQSIIDAYIEEKELTINKTI